MSKEKQQENKKTDRDIFIENCAIRLMRALKCGLDYHLICANLQLTEEDFSEICDRFPKLKDMRRFGKLDALLQFEENILNNKSINNMIYIEKRKTDFKDLLTNSSAGDNVNFNESINAIEKFINKGD